MKSAEWKTYRTRFLVQAKQLSSALSFVDPLGRTHCGRRGDYLVESSDGVISIAPRQIFEDIYVAIAPADEVSTAAHADEKFDERKSGEEKSGESSLRDSGTGEKRFALVPREKKRSGLTKLQRIVPPAKLCACPNLEIGTLNIEEIELRPIASRAALSPRGLRREEPARVRRKLPQPAGERTLSPRFSLM